VALRPARCAACAIRDRTWLMRSCIVTPPEASTEVNSLGDDALTILRSLSPAVRGQTGVLVKGLQEL
jgi:hypothetical protein